MKNNIDVLAEHSRAASLRLKMLASIPKLATAHLDMPEKQSVARARIALAARLECRA